MKTTAVRIEGGPFSLVSHPHHVAFGSSSVPAPRNLPSKENNGFDGCIMQKFRYFFFAKCANFSAFSPILLHQNNQAITRPYKNNIWIRIRARRHFCSCLIICRTVTCTLTCGIWPVKNTCPQPSPQGFSVELHFSGSSLYYWCHFSRYCKRFPNLVNESWLWRILSQLKMKYLNE